MNVDPDAKPLRDVRRRLPCKPPVSPVWRRDGVFTRSLSSFHGILRQAARAAGFSAVYVQLDHTPYAEANERELNLIRGQLDGQGWAVCGWATYGQDTDPAADGAAASEIARRLKLDGWVANGESWAEGSERDDSRKWLSEWNWHNTVACPVAVSCLSSETANFARDFDFDAWLAQPGAAVLPQVYGASQPGYTVDAALKSLSRTKVTVNRLNLTFDIREDGTGPWPDYRTWNGPRSVWTGDNSTEATWRALAR